MRPSPSSFQTTWNNNCWNDQLNHMNNISDIFGQSRSFGPLGSDFGSNNNNTTSSSSSSGGGGGAFRSSSVTNQQQQLQQQSSNNNNSISGISQSSGISLNNQIPPIGNNLNNNTNTQSSHQPIGAGRNILNISPSHSSLQQSNQQLSNQQQTSSQQSIQQQRNGWSAFVADTWNPSTITSFVFFFGTYL
jgi:hypothetical protein